MPAPPRTTAAAHNPMLEFWNSVTGVDRAFTKPITGKAYRGDSPNPTYVIRKITEQLGPIGMNWGFRVVSERIVEGKPIPVPLRRREDYAPDGQTVVSRETEHQIVFETYHQVEIEFWQMVRDERRVYSAFGGTPMRYLSKKGEWITDEDAAKKSLTDAYTKAASFLGVCADIFLGLFDDKYQVDRIAAPPEANSSSPTDAPEPLQIPAIPVGPAVRRQSTTATW